MVIAVTLKAARIIRRKAYGEDTNMAFQFPPVHALFRFEGNIYRAEWDGIYWDQWKQGESGNPVSCYGVHVCSGGYGRNGTSIGGTHVIDGIVEVPQHMLWDSYRAYYSKADIEKYADEPHHWRYNLRWCEAANTAILLKAGADHVLNGSEKAPDGLDRLTPSGLPKEGEYFRWAFDAGQQLLLVNSGLTPEQVQMYLEEVPFVPENPQGFINGFLAGYYIGALIPDYPFSINKADA